MMKQFVVDLIRAVFKHNLGSLAAIIAFFGFSSLLPLLALLIYCTSFFVSNATVGHFIQEVLQSYVPHIPNEDAFVQNTVSHLIAYRRNISIIGIGSLLWGTIGGFVCLQQILDTIYEVKHRRAFIRQYLVGFVMMAILFTLALASSIVSLISPKLLTALSASSQADFGSRLVQYGGEMMFPLILLLTCYSCYRILPSRRLRNRSLLSGALVATALIYAARFLFVIYTQHLGNYHVLYGTLTFIMLFIFWLYIACILLLFGATCAATLERVQGDGEHRYATGDRAKPG